jgi:hypothetical protein
MPAAHGPGRRCPPAPAGNPLMLALRRRRKRPGSNGIAYRFHGDPLASQVGGAEFTGGERTQGFAIRTGGELDGVRLGYRLAAPGHFNGGTERHFPEEPSPRVYQREQDRQAVARDVNRS